MILNEFLLSGIYTIKEYISKEVTEKRRKTIIIIIGIPTFKTIMSDDDVSLRYIRGVCCISRVVLRSTNTVVSGTVT